MKPLVYEDSRMIEQIREGDVKAFEMIYHKYWATLYAQAYKRLKSKESTEEVLQDFFTELWAKRETTVIHTSVDAYFRTSIKYLVLHYLQREEVRDRYRSYLEHQPDTGSLSTDELVALHELEGAVDQQIAALPPQRKLVYQLSRERHMTVPEIARHLNLSEKTVENHLGMALKALKASLKDFVAVLAIVLFQKFF